MEVKNELAERVCPNCDVAVLEHNAAEWAACKLDLYGAVALTEAEQSRAGL